MAEKIKVVKFPKKCEHGNPMQVIQRLSGAWKYEALDCKECQAVEELKRAEYDREFEVFIERLQYRLRNKT